MPFIGAVPAQKYISLAKQDFTTIAGTGYTLDQSVTNEVDIALFINHVRQEPTTAYTASGTTLTLTSATTTSDDMYCVFLGKATETINPPNSSVGTDQLEASAVTTAKIADANITSAKLASGVLPTNTPAFEARNSSAQTLSSNTITLMEFDTEVFDTDGTYTNSSTFKFTPGVSGKYFIYSSVCFDNLDNSEGVLMYLYKNGSNISLAGNQVNSANFQGDVTNIVQSWLTAIVDSDTDDYFQIYARQSDSASNPSRLDYGNIFMAYRIIT